MIRNLGRTILQRYGYKLLLVQDGQEALDVFCQRQVQIDLVILDLTLPRRAIFHVLVHRVLR